MAGKEQDRRLIAGNGAGGVLEGDAGTVDLLEAYLAAGGKVIVVGEPPSLVEAEPCRRLAALWLRQGVVRIADGFNSNTSLFKYARDLGNKRGDMYEIAVWEECIGPSGDDILFAINIPQEAVTIPETIDGIRAALCLQADRLEAVALTNQYLGMVAGR